MSSQLRGKVAAARAAAATGGGDQAPAVGVIDQRAAAAAPTGYKLLAGELVQRQELYGRASPAGGPSAQQIVTDAITALSTVDKLSECDPGSLLGAVMTCAQLGLRIGGALGQAYVLPFWNTDRRRREATFVLGYKGLVKLAAQSGRVRGLVSRTVFEQEVPKFLLSWYHDRDELRHEPYLYGHPGKPVLYYSRALLPDGGYQVTRPVHREAMQAFRRRYVKIKSGPWFDDRGEAGDGFEAMSHKTVLKQLGKTLPLSAECSLAIAADGGVRFDDRPDADIGEVTERTIEGDVTAGDQAGSMPPESAVDPDGWPSGASPVKPSEGGK